MGWLSTSPPSPEERATGLRLRAERLGAQIESAEGETRGGLERSKAQVLSSLYRMGLEL